MDRAGASNFFTLVDQLFDDSKLIPLQAKLLSQGQVSRRPSRQFKQLQTKFDEP